MADMFSKEQRSKNMQAIRSKDTSIEIMVSKALWRRGIRLRKNVTGLYGKPDFSIKKYKIVIFIDSCFWHGCEIHGNQPKTNSQYWSKKLERNKQRDKEVTEYYHSNGWNIMRIWEHDIKESFDEVIERIVEFINSAKIKKGF